MNLQHDGAEKGARAVVALRKGGRGKEWKTKGPETLSSNERKASEVRWEMGGRWGRKRTTEPRGGVDRYERDVKAQE